MRFNAGDQLLSLGVVQPDTFVLVATAGGYAKRTPIEDYPVQGRGGKGVLTLQYDRRRGTLVGALIVNLHDELYAITSTGGVIRTSAREVRKAGRQTKGVRLMNLGEAATPDRGGPQRRSRAVGLTRDPRQDVTTKRPEDYPTVEPDERRRGTGASNRARTWTLFDPATEP